VWDLEVSCVWDLGFYRALLLLSVIEIGTGVDDGSGDVPTGNPVTVRLPMVGQPIASCAPRCAFASGIGVDVLSDAGIGYPIMDWGVADVEPIPAVGEHPARNAKGESARAQYKPKRRKDISSILRVWALG
jgi:hypothetical protein